MAEMGIFLTESKSAICINYSLQYRDPEASIEIPVPKKFSGTASYI
jgi:hypothetical protein